MHVEPHPVGIDPHAPVVGCMRFGPVSEAALAQHAIERGRLEGGTKDQHLAGNERRHCGHDPGEGFVAAAQVLAHVEVHAVPFTETVEGRGTQRLGPHARSRSRARSASSRPSSDAPAEAAASLRVR